jgi:hypothetical protein
MDTSSSTADPLWAAWLKMEDDYCSSISTANANTNTNTTGKKNKAAVPWKARTMPSTPFGVPLLVSVTSTVPEKTVAWAVTTGTDEDSIWSRAPSQTKFYSLNDTDVPNRNDSALVWLPNHLPRTVPDDDDSNIKDDSEKGEDGVKDEPTMADTTNNSASFLSDEDAQVLEQVKAQVALLERELSQEAMKNAACLHDTAAFRAKRKRYFTGTMCCWNTPCWSDWRNNNGTNRRRKDRPERKIILIRKHRWTTTRP